MLQEDSRSDEPRTLRFLHRLGLVGGAWLAALVVLAVTVAGSPTAWLLLPVFPVGLADWLPIPESLRFVALFCFWAFYISLTGCLLACRKQKLFWLLYALLLVVLILNMHGCQTIGNSFGHIR